jgi:hypothetical protein
MAKETNPALTSDTDAAAMTNSDRKMRMKTSMVRPPSRAA